MLWVVRTRWDDDDFVAFGVNLASNRHAVADPDGVTGKWVDTVQVFLVLKDDSQ